MYLPRSLISHLYQQLLRSHHPLSPPVLILVALEPDALCACRILTALLKRDYIPHKIQPIAGYGDLSQAGTELVHPMHTSNGGSGGVVVCLGVGGLVDLSETLGLDANKDEPGDMGGIEVWVIDARRPWNLTNVFGGMGEPATPRGPDTQVRTSVDGVDRGRLTDTYRPGKGGIIAFDDGDIDEELALEREAYYTLEGLPDIGEDDSDDDDDSGSEREVQTQSKKRKSWSDRYDGDIAASDDEDGRPAQRRRSNSGSSIASPFRLREGRHDSSQSSRSVTPASDVPSPIIQKEPSTRTLRKRLIRLKRKHESVLQAYYSLGTSYSEPISSLLYSLASELGRDDNDLLWLAIVGVSSLELSGRTMSGVGISDASESGGSAGWGGQRGERIRQILRDEVRRLNPPDDGEAGREAMRSEVNGVIPTNARSPTDTSILLSPEPRLLLLRHWSLYDSMLHSPYLAPRLHVWNETGRKRVRKLLAKMGVSLSQCQQNYTHMDMDLKRDLRQKMLQYAPMYGMEGLVPPASSGGYSGSREGWGFARCWGWKACLSATDIGVIVGSILEVGSLGPSTTVSQAFSSHSNTNLSSATQAKLGADSANVLSRFWSAYDALAPTSDSPTQLLASIPLAQHLHRAILRTGTALLSKHQIRHLRAFRIAVVKEGPDVKLFTNPGALTKLALWIGEAVRIQEKEKGTSIKGGGKHAVGTPLVLASLDEDRNVYIVVGTGGGGGVIDFAAMAKRREEQRKKREAREKKKAEREERRAKKRAEMEEDDDELAEEAESSESESESDSESEPDLDSFSSKNLVRNRFGIAFQEVVHETNARVRIDSFEHCVVEVQKEDLGAFLEALSFRSVVG
ncbi:DNA replication initiation factor cdc45 [Microsporum canis]|uniref:Cell division control protein 45 n=1 Tax=Arthroderma otae (strain ATCC MYA-4605 / CBS 113480) TaxID=554155 RepID=C5FCJ1_ARTOC|nr:cell division control protein 45 [Microsporum canis CBS 113480]EEQ27525.1 cell division control protein 45 [Microsporum canis CBS 113480]